MGWSEGTDLFDGCVDVILTALAEAKEEPVSEEQTQLIVNEVYAQFAHTDWDTEDESCYWPYLIHTLHDIGQIDDEDYVVYLDSM